MAAESLYEVDTPAERWGAAVDRLLTMARPSETRPELAVVQGFTRHSAQRAEVRIERGSCAVSVDGSPHHELHEGARLRVRPGSVRLVDAQLD